MLHPKPQEIKRYAVKCPHCGQSQIVSSWYIDKRGKCTWTCYQCGTPFQVDTAKMQEAV